MITIRFPNGQAIQYNNGVDIKESPFTGMSYVMAKGGWIAIVPNTCIFEWEFACKVYNPLQDNINKQNERIEKLQKEIKSLKRKISKKEKENVNTNAD